MDYEGLTKAYLNNDLDWLRRNMVFTECKQLPIVGAAGELSGQDETFIQICNWMFKNGLDVNAVENNGNTGLVVACIKNNYDYAKMFIQNNADVNKKCQFGMTAIMVALNCEANKKIIEILVESGANLNEIIDSDDGKYSTLEQACYNYDTDMIEYLLQNGASVEKQKEVIDTIEWNGVKDAEEKKNILFNEKKIETIKDISYDEDDKLNNLDEKIYELLKKENKPLLISYIQKKLNIEKRRDVTQVLQTLSAEGMIYRSLKEGKALYSLNSFEGESRNPIQDNINFLQKNLSKAINQESTILTDLHIEKEEDELNDIIELNYSNNNKFSNDTYEILIPDSFKTIEEEGRDFVAYLPNPKNENSSYTTGGAIITILPGELINIANVGIQNKIPELSIALYDFSFLTAGYTMFKRYGGDPEYEEVNLNLGPTGLISMKFNDCYNFYFVTCMENHYKMMRIVIENIKGKQEQLKQIAINIMNKMVIKEKNTEILTLDNEKYIGKKLDSKLLTEWIDMASNIEENLKAYFNINMNILKKKNEKLHNEGNYNSIEYKKCIREQLNKIETIVNKYLSIIKKYLEESKNTKDELLEAYLIADNIITFFIQTSVHMEKDTITLDNEFAKKMRDELFTKEINEKLLPLKEEKEKNKSTEQKEKFEQNNKKEFEELESTFKVQISRIKRNAKLEEDDFKNQMNYAEINTKLQFNSFIRLANNLSDKYCDALEDIAIQINKIGKQFCDNGATSEYKEKILTMLKEIKDCYWNINYDFESIVIYSTTMYDTDRDSYHSEVISKLVNEWKKIYDEDPETIERKEKELKEKREKEEQKQKNINTVLNRLNDFLVKETENFAKESEEISNYTNEKINAFEQEIKVKKNSVLKQFEEENLRIKTDLENKKNNLKNEIDKYQEELNKLSFLQFIKKSELEKNIEINEINIGKYNEKLKELSEDYQNEINKVNQNYNQVFETKKQEIKNKIIYPANPNDVIEYVKTILNSGNYGPVNLRTNPEYEKQGEKIKSVLSAIKKPVTINELRVADYEMEEYSNQKLSAILKYLTDRKEVIKIVDNNKSYFSINDGSKPVKKNELLDFDVDTLFAKQRNNIYNLLYDVNDEEDVIKYLQEKNNNISELRIYQILYSLKDSGVKLIYQNNKMIVEMEVK